MSGIKQSVAVKCLHLRSKRERATAAGNPNTKLKMVAAIPSLRLLPNARHWAALGQDSA